MCKSVFRAESELIETILLYVNEISLFLQFFNSSWKSVYVYVWVGVIRAGALIRENTQKQFLKVILHGQGR